MNQIRPHDHVKLLPLVNDMEDVKVLTPSELPQDILDYLDMMGYKDLFFKNTDQIIFIASDKIADKLAIGDRQNRAATIDYVTKTIFFSGFIEYYWSSQRPLIAAILAHEAFHIKEDDKSTTFEKAEIPAYEIERAGLTTLLHYFQLQENKLLTKTILDRLNQLR